MHIQTYDTRTRTSFTSLHVLPDVPPFVRKRRTRADQVRVAPPEPRSPPSCAQRPPEHPVRTRDPRERQRAPKRRAVRLQAATPAHRPFPHASRDSATLAAHTTLRPPPPRRWWEVVVVMVVVMMVAAKAGASPPSPPVLPPSPSPSALVRPQPSPSALAKVACAHMRARASRSSIRG